MKYWFGIAIILFACLAAAFGKLKGSLALFRRQYSVAVPQYFNSPGTDPAALEHGRELVPNAELGQHLAARSSKSLRRRLSLLAVRLLTGVEQLEGFVRLRRKRLRNQMIEGLNCRGGRVASLADQAPGELADQPLPASGRESPTESRI